MFSFRNVPSAKKQFLKIQRECMHCVIWSEVERTDEHWAYNTSQHNLMASISNAAALDILVKLGKVLITSCLRMTR
jgi:hypothetical protein